MVVIVIMLSVEALGLIVQVCFFGGLSLSVGVLVPFVIYSFFTNRNLNKKGGLKGVGIKEIK